MFFDNAPDRLIELAAVLALVSAGILITFLALRRRRRKRRARAIRHARDLVQTARQALRSRSPEQALQVPIIVRLIARLAERDGFELYETGASRHSLEIMTSEARRMIKDGRSGAAAPRPRAQLALPGRPSLAGAAPVIAIAPLPEYQGEKAVVAKDGLTYFCGEVEVVVEVETAAKDDGPSDAASETFVVERTNDSRFDQPAGQPRQRPNGIGPDADKLPQPEKVDELFESLIIRKN